MYLRWVIRLNTAKLLVICVTFSSLMELGKAAVVDASTNGGPANHDCEPPFLADRIWQESRQNDWDKVKLDTDQLQKWVEAHDGDGRAMAEFLAQNFSFIKTEELFFRFEDSIKRALDEHGSDEVVIVWSGNGIAGKSGDWLAGYLRAEFPTLSKARFVSEHTIHQNRDAIQGAKTVLVIDEASFSGHQLGYLVEKLRKIRQSDSIFTVTAFMTSQAKRFIIQAGANGCINNKDMLTIEELLSKPDQGSIFLRKLFLRMYEEKDLYLTLTLFEHKVPDYVSFLHYFADGLVVDAKRKYPFSVIGKIPFIEAPRLPFYKK